MKISYLLTAAVAALALIGCGSPAATAPSNSNTAASGPAVTKGTIAVSGAWARVVGGMAMGDTKPTAAGGSTVAMDGALGAAYMEIQNSGPADKLIKVESDGIASVELHTMEMKDGVMLMRPVEGGVDIPANGTQSLKPGGFHVMLIGVTKTYKPGDKLPLKLTFEKAGTLDVQAEVRAAQ